MARFSPVIARNAPENFDLWPVSGGDGPWVHLDGTVDHDDVGAVLCAMYLDSGGGAARTADAAVHELIGFDTLFGRGGLLLDGGDGVRAEPGGSDLCEWRTWLHALHRAPVDLGHPPAPWVEYVADDVVRVWVDEGRDVPHVDVPQRALPAMLRAAQRDLVDFLGPLRSWAGVHSPRQVELLVASVDAGLQITEPLPL
ncbi:hypothetical protein ACIGNX_14715 [Actinosynnema sp. NPDC053489]|uniref:hypothetical protein n=1 Tax=Actinosynnema sp. NPDC053489 TaxID=3363916 RepID=UPI0037C5BC1D